jgi:hypothetical protein
MQSLPSKKTDGQRPSRQRQHSHIPAAVRKQQEAIRQTPAEAERLPCRGQAETRWQHSESWPGAFQEPPGLRGVNRERAKIAKIALPLFWIIYLDHLISGFNSNQGKIF